jgi:hypothetical protein
VDLDEEFGTDIGDRLDDISINEKAAATSAIKPIDSRQANQ